MGDRLVQLEDRDEAVEKYPCRRPGGRRQHGDTPNDNRTHHHQGRGPWPDRRALVRARMSVEHHPHSPTRPRRVRLPGPPVAATEPERSGLAHRVRLAVGGLSESRTAPLETPA